LTPMVAILPFGNTDALALTSWLNAHRNSAEQEPFFLAAALAYGSMVHMPSHLVVKLIYVFLTCRIVHTIAYVFRLQPWRTISFLAALFAMAIFCGIELSDACSSTSQLKAVGILAAALGLKTVATTLLTVRRRIKAGHFRPIEEDGTPAVQFLINFIAKAMLLVFPLGPSKVCEDTLHEEDAILDAWLGIHRNSVEQEVFVLAAAVAYGAVMAAPSSPAAPLLYAFLAFRLAHMVSYALRAQPWRTISFLGAVGSSVGFGAVAIAASLV